MKKLLLWLMTTKPYKWFLRDILPFIRFTTAHTKLKGYHYAEGYRLLKPGHIIVSTDDRKLTSVLIPGDWSHAAFCVAKGSTDYEIAEMTHTGYTKSFFFDICREADRVAILECVYFDEGYNEKVINRCKTFEPTLYDPQFTLGVEALYCSELIYLSDYERRIGCDLTDLAGLGRPYISPQGLYEAKNLRLVWDSKNTLGRT